MQPIKNLPSYLACEDGNIYSNITNKYLKQGINKGYKRVYIPDMKKLYFVHRLIAQSFIPNPLNKPGVNHIDGDKTNNCVSNLEWATASENMYHAYKNNLKKPTIGQGDTHYTIPLIAINKKTAEIETFNSILLAASKLNIPYDTIWRVLKGKQKPLKEYMFLKTK